MRTPDEILDEFGRDLLAARPHRHARTAPCSRSRCWRSSPRCRSPARRRDREVAVTPTPTPASVWPPPVPTPDPAAKAKVLRATPADLEALARRKWVRDVLGGGSRAMIRERMKVPPGLHEPRLVGAWSVDELKGEVLLVDDGTLRCLSVPDPLTQHPRSSAEARARPATAGSRSAWATWVGVVDPGTRAPVLRQPDGSREDLDGASGLAVLADRPPGTRVTLFDARGRAAATACRAMRIP